MGKRNGFNRFIKLAEINKFFEEPTVNNISVLLSTTGSGKRLTIFVGKRKYSRGISGATYTYLYPIVRRYRERANGGDLRQICDKIKLDMSSLFKVNPKNGLLTDKGKKEINDMIYELESIYKGAEIIKKYVDKSNKKLSQIGKNSIKPYIEGYNVPRLSISIYHVKTAIIQLKKLLGEQSSI